MRYAQYRDPDVQAAIREAEYIQQECDLTGFLDTYIPGWRTNIRNVWGWWKR